LEERSCKFKSEIGEIIDMLPKEALMVEVWIGTMALQNLQQYGCQTGNKFDIFFK
jgi:hypothetical protein